MGMRKNAPLPKKVGRKIQIQRHKLNITQEELADIVDVSRAYIGFIEQGRNAPSLEVLGKIAKALKTKVSDLF